MIYLLDTNVLLRFTQYNHPLFATIRASLKQLSEDGHQFAMMAQNCIEFWNVATRPEQKNGFGFSVEEVNRTLTELEMRFTRLADSEGIYHEWRRLVMRYEVCGVQVHDARLAAAMKFHEIRNILTLNGKDFWRFEAEGIVVVDPLSIGKGG